MSCMHYYFSWCWIWVLAVSLKGRLHGLLQDSPCGPLLFVLSQPGGCMTHNESATIPDVPRMRCRWGCLLCAFTSCCVTLQASFQGLGFDFVASCSVFGDLHFICGLERSPECAGRFLQATLVMLVHGAGGLVVLRGDLRLLCRNLVYMANPSHVALQGVCAYGWTTEHVCWQPWVCRQPYL